MIATIVRVGWASLRRSPVEMMLVFVVPIAFFSIFALIFGGTRSGTGRIKVAVADEAGTDLSRSLVRGLEKEKGLDVRSMSDGAGDGTSLKALTRQDAEAMVRDGKVAIAVVVPKGFEVSFSASPDIERPAIDLLVDTSDPIAPEMVNGLLQKVTMTAAPKFVAKSGIDEFEKWTGSLTPGQRERVESWLNLIDSGATATESDNAAANGAAGEDGPAFRGLIATRTIDVLGKTKKNPIVAFYAAAIAVMFLLFSASGAGGVILEEEESGTLDRLLVTDLGMTRLLGGKWLFVTLTGVLQITVMFLWGALVFGLELLSHLPGFFVMTVATAGAASSFGLLLATACRSRAQLSGVSTIIILMMSAVGGSMFPRIFMSETMQKIGLCTFNAWAIDGYQKVFWRDAPLLDLWPQVLVLVAIGAAFFGVARVLARRFDSG